MLFCAGAAAGPVAAFFVFLCGRFARTPKALSETGMSDNLPRTLSEIRK